MRWALVVLLVGCSPPIPNATYVCGTTDDCPPDHTCFEGLCYTEAPSCTPMSCLELRAQCGTIDDGCGTDLDCGTCEAPEECGLTIPNICDCMPRRCSPDDCEVVDSGCGGLIECGGCDAGQDCTEGSCSCTPDTCDGRCGDIPDGCGDLLTCGGCMALEVCGGGGPNVCGSDTCTPTTCAAEGSDCGMLSDGCGVVLECGACADPGTCGGGSPGIEGVCGCTPQTCATLGANCGSPMEKCGTTLSCGTCTLPLTCGGGGTAEVCGCTPDATEPNDTRTAPHLFLPPLVPDIAQAYAGLNVFPAANHDWYHWNVAPGMYTRGVRVLVVLSSIPVGQDYDLEVYVACALGGGTLTEPVCVQGLDIGVGGAKGCSASNAGSTAEVVEMMIPCPVDEVLVHVVPVSGGSCEAYTLTTTVSTPL